MKKNVTSFICLATYCLGQTTAAYAHGAHGAETSLSHQFTEPQHLISLLAIASVISLFTAMRKTFQTASTQK
ncbi:MAG: hypothetical protein P8J25_06335 [Porticoccaceae bacterium]|nr:hypothetical protein [Porticoccaceae bacterium]